MTEEDDALWSIQTLRKGELYVCTQGSYHCIETLHGTFEDNSTCKCIEYMELSRIVPQHRTFENIPHANVLSAWNFPELFRGR